MMKSEYLGVHWGLQNLQNHKKNLITFCTFLTSSSLKNENKLETLIQTIRIYSQDIGMEWKMEKDK